jgi:hypothetical protein
VLISHPRSSKVFINQIPVATSCVKSCGDKLRKKSFTSDWFKFFYTYRVVNVLNDLPETSEFIAAFKKALKLSLCIVFVRVVFSSTWLYNLSECFRFVCRLLL